MVLKKMNILLITAFLIGCCVCACGKEDSITSETLEKDTEEIIFQERRYQEKPIFQGLQKLWNAVRCVGIYIECNTYAAGMQQRY